MHAGSVRVSPEPLDLRRHTRDRWLFLSGDIERRRTYRVTLGAEVRCVDGRVLGETQVYEIAVPAPKPEIVWPCESMGILRSHNAPVLPIETIGVAALEISVRVVRPEHWAAWQRYIDRRRARSSSPPGDEVVQTRVDLDSRGDRPTVTRVDLRSALRDGVGHAIVIARPDPPLRDGWPSAVEIWVQRTGLMCVRASDTGGHTIRVVSASDGGPVSGARVSAGDFHAECDSAGVARVSRTALGSKRGVFVA